MFGMLEDLVKAATVVVTVPVSVVADVVTMGGDGEKTHTEEALEDFLQNLKNATKPK